MPTNQSIFQDHAVQVVTCDIDIANTGTVGTVRGDGLVVTKTGTGTYTVQVKNTDFYEVVFRGVQLHFGTQANAIQHAAITSITANSGAGTGAVINITTYDDNASPAAANLTVTSTCQMSVQVHFRRWKVQSP